jgi:hypothetical protein
MPDPGEQAKQPQQPSASPAEGGIKFTDLNNVAAASQFYTPGQPGFNGMTAEALVAREIEADPVLKNRTVMIMAQEGTSYKDSLEAAVAKTNAIRAESGLAPISKAVETQAVTAMYQVVTGNGVAAAWASNSVNPDKPNDPARPQDSVSFVFVPSQPGLEKSIKRLVASGLGLIHPDAHASAALKTTAHEMFTDRKVVATHELTHDATSGRPTGDDLPIEIKEGVADATKSYTAAAYGTQDIGKSIMDMADARTLAFGDHALAADALLKARHHILQDPDGVKAQLQGVARTLSGREEMAAREAVGAGSSTVDVLAAQNGIDGAQAVLGGCAHELLSGKAVPIPEGLARDTAVSLLRTQLAEEHHNPKGADNDLSRIMPKLWEHNREAFAAAQDYMEKEYGIRVTAPNLPPEAPPPDAHVRRRPGYEPAP